MMLLFDTNVLLDHGHHHLLSSGQGGCMLAQLRLDRCRA